jgi:hypothetical protein
MRFTAEALRLSKSFAAGAGMKFSPRMETNFHELNEAQIVQVSVNGD